MKPKWLPSVRVDVSKFDINAFGPATFPAVSNPNNAPLASDDPNLPKYPFNYMFLFDN